MILPAETFWIPSVAVSPFTPNLITMAGYSGCKKNVPVFERFFLQPLMPQFRHLEYYYGKRYK